MHSEATSARRSTGSERGATHVATDGGAAACPTRNEGRKYVTVIKDLVHDASAEQGRRVPRPANVFGGNSITVVAMQSGGREKHVTATS